MYLLPPGWTMRDVEALDKELEGAGTVTLRARMFQASAAPNNKMGTDDSRGWSRAVFHSTSHSIDPGLT